jgi:type II secretory pathway pseudopilin PulG
MSAGSFRTRLLPGLPCLGFVSQKLRCRRARALSVSNRSKAISALQAAISFGKSPIPRVARPGLQVAHSAGTVQNDRGFSLLEALVATAVLATGIATLAQLAFMAMRATERARLVSFATIVAEAKMEDLRAAAAASDAPMPHSPDGSLESNTAGFCDFLDRYGNPIPGGDDPPPNTVYIRRWSIGAVAINPTLALLQVQVARADIAPVRLVGLVPDPVPLP